LETVVRIPISHISKSILLAKIFYHNTKYSSNMLQRFSSYRNFNQITSGVFDLKIFFYITLVRKAILKAIFDFYSSQSKTDIISTKTTYISNVSNQLIYSSTFVIKAFLFIVLTTSGERSWGQTVVTVGGGATISCPAVPNATWTTPPTGVTFSNWSRGTGVTCASANDGISGSVFNAADAATGYANNSFYKVSITAAATHTFVLSSVTWLAQVSSGSANFTIKCVNNGGAATDFGTAGQSGSGSSISLTFSGSVTVAAGTTLDIYLIPYGTNTSGRTVRFKNGSTFTVTASAAGNSSPILNTPTAASITNTSANLGATISSNGGIDITESGVVYGTSAMPTGNATLTNPLVSGNVAFTVQVGSLNPETQYFYRGYAINTEGTGYSPDGNFRTISNPPTNQASGLNGVATSATALNLTWTPATFPVSGATTKGYVLLRATSPNTPSLSNTNGAAPAAGPSTTIVSSTILEGATSQSNSGLTVNTTYNYLLIPYCWDGVNASTYNYLTISAPTAAASTPSNTSDVVAVASSESATISSLINDAAPLTSTSGTQVWQFTVRDGGSSLNDGDNLPTIVSGITFTQNAGNTIDDWSEAIKTVALFDGTTWIADGAITSNNITFSGLNIIVADNTSMTLSLRLSLNETLNNVGSGNLDGDDFVFNLTNANFLTLTNGSSSTKASFLIASSTNGQNAVSIEATKLTFVQHPTTVATNTNISPSVTIHATDVGGNRDRNFVSNVDMTATGSTLTGSPVSVVAVLGLATFSTLQFTDAANGVTLSANATGLTGVTSDAFNVTLPLSAYQFRTRQSGDWGNVNSGSETWEKSTDGVVWVNSDIYPNSSGGAITIKAGHTVTLSAVDVTVDEVTVEATGQITVNSGRTLTVADGSGDDIILNGILSNAGTIIQNSGATIAFASGSEYIHAQNAGTIPTGTFDPSSNITVTGVTTVAPNFLSSTTYGNVTWNCTSQSFSVNLLGSLRNIAGNLTIANTGTGILRLNGGTGFTFTIGGSLIINSSNSTLQVANGTSNNNIINVGSWNQSAGTFNPNTGSSVLEIRFTGASGAFEQSAGILTNTVINWKVNSGASLSLASNLPVASSRSLIVDGTLTIPNAMAVTGLGSVTISNTGILKVGSTAVGGAIGSNIATTLNALASGSTVEFNGSGPQFAEARTFSNLTINNSNGVTLLGDLTINGTLTLNSGNITTSSYKVITASGASISRSSGHIAGNLQRRAANGSNSFPIGAGSVYAPVVVEMTGVSGIVDITGFVTAGNHPNEGTSPLDPSKKSNHYWTFTQLGAGTFTSYTGAFDVTNTTNTGSVSNYKMAKYEGAWSAAGGSASGNVVTSASFTSFGDFIAGEESSCLNVALASATAAASTICSDATTTLTYSGLAGTNASVTWTQNADGTGNTYGVGTPSDPVGPGTYYAYATGDCGSAVSIAVTISGQYQPDAGISGTLAVCAGTTPSNEQLFAALGGTPDAGGGWSNTGLVYTYTVNATAPCTENATATVTLSEQTPPNAGTNGTLTVCAGTTPSNEQLFAALGGTPDAGGDWSNLGLVYTYTVYATAPCTVNATATVTISVNSIDYANLQFPFTANYVACAGTLTAYGRVWVDGVTNVAGADPSIEVQIGYHSANTDPSTWSNWSNASFNVQVGNDDEYSGTIPNLTSGTYYYTFRYRRTGCSWHYGGTGGFWNGTSNNSGVLTVTPQLTYVNLQYPASGNICSDGNFDIFGQVFKAGVTEPAGDNSDIEAEFGYSMVNNNPADWTNWASATYNSQVGNNDEYKGIITGLAAGVYYYTFRYRYNNCEWQYGGYNSGSWNGTSNVSGVLTVNANYTITASSGLNGSISPDGIATLTCLGTGDQTYTITPASCYSIADVLVDGNSVGAVSSYTFTDVTANRTISASFVLNTYTITVSSGSGGSVSPATGNINCGANATYTITADAGYFITDVTVDGVPATALTTGNYSTGGTYEFTNVTAAHTISVTFGSDCVNVGLSGAMATLSPICSEGSTTLTYTGLTGTNPSVTWYSGSGATGISYGTGTPSSPVGPGTYYAYAIGTCGNPVEIPVVVGETAQMIPTSAGTYTSTLNHVNGATNSYSDISCNLLSRIEDASGGNELGNTTVNVLLTATYPLTQTSNAQTFGGRKVTVTPGSGGTATLTLYYDQSDFTFYNGGNGTLDVPSSGSDSNPNIDNLRIAQVTVGGNLDNFQAITPSSVTWNESENRWEVVLNNVTLGSNGSDFYFYGLPGCNAEIVTSSSATTSSTTASISWTGTPSASFYWLRFRKSNPVGPWTVVGAANTSLNLAPLDPNSTYEYQIRVICPSSAGLYSNSFTFTTDNEPCGSAAVISSINQTSNSATISWNGISGVGNYQLWYHVVNSPNWFSVTTSSTAATINGLQPGTNYEVKIRNTCSSLPGYWSQFSGLMGFQTQNEVCAQPATITSVPATSTTVTINWSPLAGVSQYQIWYKAVSSPNWIGYTIAGTSYTIGNLTPNTNYHVKIRNMCTSTPGVWSSFSPLTLFQTLNEECVIPAIINMPISTTSSSATISWNAVSGVSLYQILYRVVGSPYWYNKITSNTSIVLSGIDSGTNFEVHIRNACSSNGIFGPYSLVSYPFTTAPPPCSLPPSGVTVSGITTNVAHVSWNIVSSYGSFRVRYKLDNASSWDSVTTTSLNTFITELTSNSLYQCQVKTICNNTYPGVSSGYGGVVTFMTAAEGIAPSPTLAHQGHVNTSAEVTGRNKDTQLSGSKIDVSTIHLYPNPTSDVLNLSFESGQVGDVQISMMDVSGRIAKEMKFTTVAGSNNIQINLDDLSHGVYMIQVSAYGTRIYTGRVIKIE
jgi:Secretion system C-terminal sorting domain/Fibronectin type III domain